MTNRKELSTNLCGRLSDSFRMYTIVSVTKTDTENNVNVKAFIEKLKDIDSTIKLEKEKITIILSVGDNIIKKSLELNNSNSVIKLLDENFIYNNEEPVNLKESLKLIVSDNESHYIDNTELVDYIILSPIKQDKLFIDLVGNELSDYILCVVETNVVPDFLEYKVDTNDWIKLSVNNFRVLKTGNNQYIQVRGKHNGVYSYSNTYKIYKK